MIDDDASRRHGGRAPIRADGSGAIARERSDRDAAVRAAGVATTDEGETDAFTRRPSVLITGCSSGIGRSTAKAFLEDGWRVYATARDTDDLVALERAGCATASLDVTDHEQVTAAVDRVVEETGAIDCLVNNAGYAQLGPVEDVSVEDLHHQFAVNVYGPHRLIRAALPHMRERGEGRIVNVSSISGLLSVPGSGPYSASKFALEALSDSLRAEVEEFGVEVVLVEPGPVATSFAERATEELPDDEPTLAYEPLYDLIEDWETLNGGPLASSPGDVAQVILQAATCTTPQARYPVGAVASYGSLARLLPESIRDQVYGLVRRLT